jgi:hypothetical protein
VDGKTYEATYEVAQGIVTVRTAKGMKATQVGGSPPEVLARMMLREMVREGRV